MSVAIWPPISDDQLKTAWETTQKRELEWLLDQLYETLKNLKEGLEECHALLAPVDPGSTLVLSTPRNEIVKGTITRVGTKIVKGTIHLRLRTLPSQTLIINADRPIELPSLASLTTLLTQSIELLAMTLLYAYPSRSGADVAASRPTQKPEPLIPPTSSPYFLSTQLRILSQTLAEASAILRGPPVATGDPAWTTRSVAAGHFSPPLGSNPHPSLASPFGTATTPQTKDEDTVPPISFYIGLQESCLVLWLRSLEPADAPVHFGTKLALAIGTTRRLEHDEAERVFGFRWGGGGAEDGGGRPATARPGTKSTPAEETASTTGTGDSSNDGSSDVATPNSRPTTAAGGERKPLPNTTNGRQQQPTKKRGRETDVYVREKVRVESADPSLLSVAAKLSALGHALGIARRNLAAVMEEDLGEEDDEEAEGH